MDFLNLIIIIQVFQNHQTVDLDKDHHNITIV